MPPTTADEILFTYDSQEYRPDEFSRLNATPLPQDLVAACAQVGEGGTPREQLKRGWDVLSRIEQGIRSQCESCLLTAKKINNDLRVPLMLWMQRLSNEVEIERMDPIPYKDVCRILAEIYHGAQRQHTRKEHECVNPMGDFKDELWHLADCQADADAQHHPSHGLLRTGFYAECMADGRINTQGKFEITHEVPGFAQCTGNGAMGHTTVDRAYQHAKMRLDGSDIGSFVIAGLHTFHAGRVERIIRKAVEDGFAATGIYNTEPEWNRAGAHPNGSAPCWSTNPICYGAPTDNHGNGFVVDIATTESSEGRLQYAHLNGLMLERGLSRGRDGVEILDPRKHFVEPLNLIQSLGGKFGKQKGAGLGQGIHHFVNGLKGRHLAPTPNEFGNNFVFWFVKIGDPGYEAVRDSVESVRHAPNRFNEENRIPGEEGATALAIAKKQGLRPVKTTWEGVVLPAYEQYAGK